MRVLLERQRKQDKHSYSVKLCDGKCYHHGDLDIGNENFGGGRGPRHW